MMIVLGTAIEILKVRYSWPVYTGQFSRDLVIEFLPCKTNSRILIKAQVFFPIFLQKLRVVYIYNSELEQNNDVWKVMQFGVK